MSVTKKRQLVKAKISTNSTYIKDELKKLVVLGEIE